uniref:RRM domain-containing protein n=3 Tax=Rhodnius prolixus TaxID=13249 RepID=A0A905R0W5_RHOPR
MLEKAGLDFVDILLVNSDSRPFAEISFIDLASREKALTLDKTLSHLGQKIKIKPI